MIHSVPTRRSYDLVAVRTDKLHPLDLDRIELGVRRGIGMGELRHLALGIADIDVGGQQHAVARIEKTTVGEWRDLADKIGRAHVLTPVTNAHLVCRLLLEKKKKLTTT